MPTFSIILPVRNGGAYFKECVNSILSQTYTGFNLIILDNKNTDGSLEWIVTLNDKRIIVHTTDIDLGISENWARIKDVPKNEFITLIGHDDILLPHYLETMDALIKKHPDASLYQAHFDYIDEKGKLLVKCKPMDEIQYAHEFIAMQFLQMLDSTGTGYMMRSKDYDRLGGIPTDYPGFIFADYELWVRLISLNYKATALESCFQYRINNSASKIMNAVKYKDSFLWYIDFLIRASQADQKIKNVIYNYGINFLNYYTQSLAHRLLKQPGTKKDHDVKAFINSVIEKAGKLELNGRFHPYGLPLTKLAAMIDSFPFGRKFFSVYQLIQNRK